MRACNSCCCSGLSLLYAASSSGTVNVMPLSGSEVFLTGAGDAVPDAVGVGVAEAFGVVEALGVDDAVDDGALSGRTSLACGLAAGLDAAAGEDVAGVVVAAPPLAVAEADGVVVACAVTGGITSGRKFRLAA